MSKHLRKHYGYPLEREFEGWIVSGIERYFSRLNEFCEILAIGPTEEVAWPADEAVYTGAKLFGLQFKQARMAQPSQAHRGDPEFEEAPDRLKWSLHHPPGQYDLVGAHPEIFYCLPTFTNRAFRRNALHHCVFWRPGTTENKNLWYDNANAQTPYKKLKSEPRWGLFIEEVFNCNYGYRVRDRESAKSFAMKVQADMREKLKMPPDPEEPATSQEASPQELGLYLVMVKRES